MSEKEKGGPAFPVKYTVGPGQKDAEGNVLSDMDHVTVTLLGMTLRDYFAAKAMQAMLSTYPCPTSGAHMDFADVAGDAYEMADAMLKAREE